MAVAPTIAKQNRKNLDVTGWDSAKPRTAATFSQNWGAANSGDAETIFSDEEIDFTLRPRNRETKTRTREEHKGAAPGAFSIVAEATDVAGFAAGLSRARNMASAPAMRTLFGSWDLVRGGQSRALQKSEPIPRIKRPSFSASEFIYARQNG
jgi:hypothetical protein